MRFISRSGQQTSKVGRLVGRAAAGLLVSAAAVVAVPAAAEASAPCDAQVCLFDGAGNFVGSYRDVTSHFQAFHRFRSASATNGFGDNAVYFTYENGQTSCIQPQRTASLEQPGYGRVVGIMVRPGGNCYPNNEIQ